MASYWTKMYCRIPLFGSCRQAMHVVIRLDFPLRAMKSSAQTVTLGRSYMDGDAVSDPLYSSFKLQSVTFSPRALTLSTRCLLFDMRERKRRAIATFVDVESFRSHPFTYDLHSNFIPIRIMIAHLYGNDIQVELSDIESTGRKSGHEVSSSSCLPSHSSSRGCLPQRHRHRVMVSFCSVW